MNNSTNCHDEARDFVGPMCCPMGLVASPDLFDTTLTSIIEFSVQACGLSFKVCG